MRCKFIVLLVLAFSLFAVFSNAAPNDLGSSTSICAEAAVTNINPSSVDANQDFTVGIVIDNCGNVIPKNITFEIMRLSPDITVKEPLINHVGDLGYANSKRFILYHMRTSPDIPPGAYYFEAKLDYGDGSSYITRYYNFSITVETDKPDLSISGFKTSPDRINPKQDVILTLKVENSGKGSAKEVMVRLEGLDFEGVKDAYIGEINPNEELPARFVLRSGNAESSNFNAKIFYKSAGENNMVQFPLGLQVFSTSISYWWIIGGVIVILAIFLFYLKSRSKTKDDEE
jgi:hypothetical protein